MAKLDFFSPHVSAELFNPVTGRRYPFWTDADPVALEAAGVPLHMKALSYLQEVTVTLNLGPIPVITASLALPFEEGIAFIDSSLVEWGMTHLRVQFGYTGTANLTLSPVYSGVLLKPEVETTGEGVTITLKGQGVGGYSAIRQRSKVSTGFEVGLRFVGDLLGSRTLGGGPRSRKELIERILAGPDLANARSLTLNLDRLVAAGQESANRARAAQAAFQVFGGVVGVEVPASFESYKLMFEDPIDYDQGSDTDWWAIQKLVRQCRCAMTLIGEELVVIPLNLQFGTAPVRILRQYHHGDGIGGDTGVLPILSYKTTSTHQYLPGAIRGMIVRGMDSKTRAEVQLTLTDQEVATTRTSANGAVGVPASEDYPGGGEDVLPGSPVDQTVLQSVRAEMDAFTANAGIEATVMTLGDPTLLPADVVAVQGLGVRLSTNYVILEIVHKGGLSGYDMDLKLISNVAQAIAEYQASGNDYNDKPAGDENKNEPPEGPSDDSTGVPAANPN